MKLARLVVAVVCVTAVAPGAWAEFKAGAAMRVVTPKPLLPVSGGMGKPNPAEILNDDLTVRAAVFEKDGERVAFVGTDFLGFSAVLGNKVRALIPGIPADRILIGCTHTHSGPDTYAFPDEKGNHGADLKYLDWVCEQAAAAVNEAVAKLQPAALKIAMGDAKGKIAYNYYAPALYDPRCGVIQAIATKGKRGGAKKGATIVTVVNYAIHPEVIGNDQKMLGPDLCGPLYDRIEEKAGGLALFMNGAQGGMVTADCRGPEGKDIQTWEECIRIGNLLADEALRIVADAAPQQNPGLHVEARRIAFPLDSPELKYVLEKSPLKGELTADGKVPTTLNLVNLGTAQILTVPGEALPNIGYYVKRNMNTKQPMLFGLTNDALGYMLTKEDFRSFERYNYVSRVSLGEMTGDIYIDEALKLVKDSPKPDGQ
jgi:hypothetical protein